MEFSNLNSYYKEYIEDAKTNEFSYFLEQLKYLQALAEYIFENYISFIQEKEKDENQEFLKTLSQKEVIQLVSEYLLKTDPLLFKKFNEALEKGIIRLRNYNELDESKKTIENCHEYYCCNGLDSEGNEIINILCKENISDAFALVHEFSHYANGTYEEENIKFPMYLYGEGFANYFETDFFHFLKKKPFHRDATIYYNGLMECFCIRAIDFEFYSVFIEIYLMYGIITKETIIKYATENKFSDDYISLLLEEADNLDIKYSSSLERFINHPFDEARYVIGFFLSHYAERYPKKKVLEDYWDLKNKSIEDIHKKYMRMNNDHYKQKLKYKKIGGSRW